MTLQRKTLLIIAITSLCLLAVVIAMARFVLLRGFDAYETSRARHEAELIRRSYLARLQQMDLYLQQISAWDDMAGYVQTPTPDFENSNFVDSVFESLGLNVLIVMQSDGRLVFARGYDLLERRSQPVSRALLETVQSSYVSNRLSTPRASLTGLITLPEDPMLIAARPIVSSGFEGPVRGLLLLGRYADGELANQSGALLDREVTASAWQSAPFSVRAQLKGPSDVYAYPLTPTELAAYARLDDIAGNPALVLRASLPREVYAAKVITGRTMLTSLLAAGVVYGVVVTLLLRYSVLSRVASLESEVRGIAHSGDARRRVALHGNDELTRLADSVNGMLQALEASREALRHSEETSRALMNATMDSAFLVNRGGTVLAVNEAGARRLGMNIDEITGVRLRELFPSALAEARMTRIREAFDTGRAVRFQDCRGSIHFDVTLYPVANADGQVERLAIFAHDITEIRQAEEALRESRTRYRQLVQGVNSVVLRWDPNGIITFMNEYGQNFFGWSWQELVGQSVMDTIVPETDASGVDLRELIQDLLRNPQKYVSSENENIRKNGERVWMSWSNRPVFDDAGKLIEILSIGNDITRRRKAEQALVHRVQMEELVASVSSRFLSAPASDMQETVIDVLRTVGEFVGADRAYIFFMREDGKTIDLTHEWCAPGIPPLDSFNTGLSADQYTWFAETLFSEGVVYIPDASVLPDEAAPERIMFESQNVQSLLDVPMLWRGEVIGILGFSCITHKAECSQDDIRLLKIVAGVMVAAFQRVRAEEAILLQTRRLEALIELQDMAQSGPGEMIGFVLQKAVDLTRSAFGLIGSVTGHTGDFVPDHWAQGDSDAHISQDQMIQALATTELLDTLRKTRKPLVLDQTALPAQTTNSVMRLLAVPILERDRMEAVAIVANKPLEYDEADMSQMQLLLAGAWNQIKRNEAVAWIQHEVDEIANIQRALLPRAMPTVKGMRVRAFSSTFDRAGGDYYDVLPVGASPDHDLKTHPRWLVFIADVSGHGPSSAVVVAMLSTLLRLRSVGDSSPARILEYLNRHLMARTIGQAFVTGFLALIDLGSRTMVYSNAGHNPPLLRTPDGAITELHDTGDIPLNVRSDWSYNDRTLEVEPGTTLWLYTDGVVETLSPDGEAFGESRLAAAIGNLEGESSRAVAELVGMLRAHEAGRRPNDDQVIMLVEFK